MTNKTNQLDQRIEEAIKCPVCNGSGRADTMAGASECSQCGGDGHQLFALEGIGYEDLGELKQAFRQFARDLLAEQNKELEKVADLLLEVLPFVDPEDPIYSKSGKARVRGLEKRIENYFKKKGEVLG